MSYFVQNGDIFSPTSGRDSFLDGLPAGNYIVIETMQGLMFRRVDSFEAPGRMYGKINERAQRIMQTFLDRDRATGVLLAGEKGSGKSQLARIVSYMGYEQGIPTILINAAWRGDAFNALLATVEQPAIILMDEFEKVYDDGEQEAVLTLLDGTMTTKKLFILTVNDSYRVTSHMKNRPGRLYYAIDFHGLEADFVREYCEDNLQDQSQIDSVVKVSGMFGAFNFDMLKAIVEEMNRYKEDPYDVIELLNAKPFTGYSGTVYDVTVETKGGFISEPINIDLPMNQSNGKVGHYVEWKLPKGESKAKKFRKEFDLEDDEDNASDAMQVETKNMVTVDPANGTFDFLDHKGRTVRYRRAEAKVYDLRSM